jgi:hypothetical protein
MEPWVTSQARFQGNGTFEGTRQSKPAKTDVRTAHIGQAEAANKGIPLHSALLECGLRL